MADYRYKCDKCGHVTNAYDNDTAAKDALITHKQWYCSRKDSPGTRPGY